MLHEGNATPDDCIELDGAVIKEVSIATYYWAAAKLYSVKNEYGTAHTRVLKYSQYALNIGHCRW